MITVDKTKCSACGLCADICHEQCIALMNGSVETVPQIDHSLCSTCTQCIAICPRQALSWDRVAPVRYKRSELPTAEQIAELFKERRTVRAFKDKPIERTLLAEVASYGIYAPTNNYQLRAIVVDDRALIEALDAIIMRYVAWIYNLFYRWTPLFNLLAALTPLLDPKTKVKMERGLAEGSTFGVPPAAMLFIAGDRRILMSEASAQYALYNIILYAQTKGIGSRINAAGPLTLDRSRAARKWLGLGKEEHILATLDLGYPAVRFSNKVEGKRMPISWKGKGAHA